MEIEIAQHLGCVAHQHGCSEQARSIYHMVSNCILGVSQEKNSTSTGLAVVIPMSDTLEARSTPDHNCHCACADMPHTFVETKCLGWGAADI